MDGIQDLSKTPVCMGLGVKRQGQRSQDKFDIENFAFQRFLDHRVDEGQSWSICDP